MGVMSQ